MLCTSVCINLTHKLHIVVYLHAVIYLFISFIYSGSHTVETEEAALLHEEATMTIEELLARYGQNRNAVKHVAALR